ncbi:MAG TPA: peptidoglycan-binding protein [Candidatus Flavonifractor intestinipullorum]|uniref:Peptidoglycan-binding protein n=1 Tax=Candidatus Flavonifractor intestinipullorum TaxID=2838587 RepID=A0A9D2M975_9FIRM|nr:peptidoglycan-binding protein [Candidatus Flavonifractor intestinipullorum]
MPPIVTPYIPQTITVHLGPPGSSAENVTVSFPDYVKNVASSEIYPTWEPAALEANILAIISFALNRVYTEFYPSRGYPFQITSETAYDQKFIKGRNTYENIDRMVDELFTTYIRRQGYVEPLSAKFCNGTTTTCDGLSQWGSQALAQEGYSAMDILRYYYGDDIELVTDAPVMGLQQSYPGAPLRRGDRGAAVVQLQTMLNQVSRDFPAIPRLREVDGVFDADTEEAVRAFQEVFGLAADGVVGRATWYKLVYLYVGIRDLAELAGEGQDLYGDALQRLDDGQLAPGSRGRWVRVLQYMLTVLASFYNDIPAPAQDGIYGEDTRQAVLAFQRNQSLPQTGIVDAAVWQALYQAYTGIRDTVVVDGETFPAAILDIS